MKVTVVFPGAIETNITANSGLQQNPVPEKESGRSFKMTSASDAAAIILNGVEKDRYRVLVGSNAKFMDFIYRLNPEWAAGFICKQMKSLLGG